MGVVETAVACHLGTDEIGLFIGLRLTAKLHLGHHETVVVTVKLIHLKRVGAARHKVTVLVDDPALAKPQQMGGLVKRNLFLKLVARQSVAGTVALYRQVSPGVAHAHPDRSAVGWDIALPDMARRCGGLAVGPAMTDQKLALYL